MRPSGSVRTTLTELVPRSTPRMGGLAFTPPTSYPGGARRPPPSAGQDRPRTAPRRSPSAERWWSRSSYRQNDLVSAWVVLKGVQRVRVLVQAETVRDEAGGGDPAGLQGGDRRAKGRHLGVGAPQGELAAEQFVRSDADLVLGPGDAVEQHAAAVADERDAQLGDLERAGGFDDDVVAALVGVFPQRGEVGLALAATHGGGAGGAEVSGDLELERLVAGHGDRRGAAGGQELGEQQPRRARTHDKGARPRPDLQSLQAVHGAGSRFDEHGRVESQPGRGEHERLGHARVVGEEAVAQRPEADRVATLSGPAGLAVRADPAGDVRVDADLVADREPGDAVAELGDEADHLVAEGDRERCSVVAVVDVHVGAAQPGLLDRDEYLPRHRFGSVDVTDAVLPGSGVADRFHPGRTSRAVWRTASSKVSAAAAVLGSVKKSWA